MEGGSYTVVLSAEKGDVTRLVTRETSYRTVSESKTQPCELTVQE